MCLFWNWRTFYSLYRRVKKRANFKTNKFLQAIQSFLYCLNSSICVYVFPCLLAWFFQMDYWKEEMSTCLFKVLIFWQFWKGFGYLESSADQHAETWTCCDSAALRKREQANEGKENILTQASIFRVRIDNKNFTNYLFVPELAYSLFDNALPDQH